MTEPHLWGLRRGVRNAVHTLQDRLAHAVGVEPEDRTRLLGEMLQRKESDAVGYWLQLLIATGIAILGLAQGSTAVVIGAMLISPLMTPIVELGMGLGAGSPFLVFRSVLRCAVSVAVVVGTATLITWLLPYQTVTGELRARTTPNALDLFIAIACAIAAAYTTVRRGAAVSTAAGTAIGIALVPPLCTVGFGLGIESRTIAAGAALLFTANFCAILLFTVVIFLLLGYHQCDVDRLEADELAKSGGRTIARTVARAFRRVFVAKYSVIVKLLLPAALVVSVYFPLRSALEEVAWQVRVRGDVEETVRALPVKVVRSQIVVERSTVAVSLVVLGSNDEARTIRDELDAEVRRISGVVPNVDVVAIPDEAAVQEYLSAVEARAVAAVPVVQAPPPPPPVDEAIVRIHEALAARWPAAAGPVIDARVELDGAADAGVTLEVVHRGAPLDAVARDLLATAVGDALDRPVAVRTVTLPPSPLVADGDADAGWAADAATAIARLRPELGLRVCLGVPPPPPPAPPTPGRRNGPAPAPPAPPPWRALVEATAARAGVPVDVETTPAWTVRLEPSCAPPPPPDPAAPGTAPAAPAPGPAPGGPSDP